MEVFRSFEIYGKFSRVGKRSFLGMNYEVYYLKDYDIGDKVIILYVGIKLVKKIEG